jgi:hypothetical protein
MDGLIRNVVVLGAPDYLTRAPLFRGEAEVPQLQSGVAIRRFRTSVPSTLAAAVSRRYEIKQYPWLQRVNPVDGLTRASGRRD